MVDDAFILLSAWWVKSLVFVAAALAVDVARRERPWRALTVAVAFGLSSLCSTLIKVLVDRPRPDGDTLIELPTSASFPSGHATTAFAAAVALALLLPRTAWWGLPLAALIAYSRVHLGVHYWTDVVAGAVLGTLVAVAVVRVGRMREDPGVWTSGSARWRRTTGSSGATDPSSRAPSATPPASPAAEPRSTSAAARAR